MRFAIVHHTVNATPTTGRHARHGPGDLPLPHPHQRLVRHRLQLPRRPYGHIYEGRAGGITEAVVGAHAAGFNTPEHRRRPLGHLQHRARCRRRCTPPCGHPGVEARSSRASTRAVTVPYNGRLLAAVSGHRDVNATDCPGDISYGLLPQLRGELASTVNMAPRSALIAAHSNKVMDVPGQPEARHRHRPVGLERQRQPAVAPGAAGWRRLQDRLRRQRHGARRRRRAFDGRRCPHRGVALARRAQPAVDRRSGRFGTTNLYVMVSRLSGKVLDVGGRSTANGASIFQWTWNGGDHQIWVQIRLLTPFRAAQGRPGHHIPPGTLATPLLCPAHRVKRRN